MKSLLMSVVIFLVAVALSLSAFVFFNDQFNKLFNLNSGASGENKEMPEDNKIDLKRTGSNKIQQFIDYSQGKATEYPPRVMYPENKDTVYMQVYKDSTLLAKYNQLSGELNDVRSTLKFKENELASKTTEIDNLKSRLSTSKDSAFTEWRKNTVKMFEAMDSKKAAVVLASYSDEMARELLYSMKKKKAAEILSLMNSEKVITLTKAEQ